MAEFRVCPDSGFYFNKSAESLMKVNAVVGVVALLIAGLLAIGVVLTRWQEVHWLPADTFYMVLTGHGINALLFWVIFFEMAIFTFCLLNIIALSSSNTAMGVDRFLPHVDWCSNE